MKTEKEIENNNSNTETKKRIWKIRDSIRELASVKDKIIDYLSSNDDLDDSTRDMWVTDGKEVYYNIVAAWEMLSGISRGEDKYIDSCMAFLEAAESRLEQSSSELKSLGDEKATQLESEVRKTFERCYQAISAELEKLSPKKEYKKPTQRVIKVSDEEYQLPCSICGKIAVVFRVGIPRFEKEENLIYDGITHSQSIGLRHLKKIFSWLEEENISKIHSYVRKDRILEDGIDAYCPDCDKTYCRSHYDTREEWDEGFYDCTYGSCPEGHTRIIDD